MRKQKPPVIVPENQLQDVRAAQLAISNAMPVLAKLEACGVDCQCYREAFAEYDAALRKIMENFGTPAVGE